jgi:integrase
MPALTVKRLQGLKVPKGKRDAVLFDTTCPGFGVRKFESGRMSFFLKYSVDGKKRKVSLGPAVPTADVIESARSKACIIQARAQLGEDEIAKREARRQVQRVSLKQLIERFLDAKREDMSETYFRDNCRYLRDYWSPLHDQAVQMIKRVDAVNVLDEIADKHGKATADRARSALSSFFGWALDRGYCETNPLIAIKNRANGKRHRTLNDAELRHVWRAAADTGDHGIIVRLLILTGQRKSEIADLQWSEIKDGRIELPPERTKNGRPHIVPLSPEAGAIIKAVPIWRADSDYVFGEGKKGFQGWSKAKRALDAKLRKIEPWRLHDLRRSVVTGMNEHGIAPPHIIEAVVNHISGHRGGIAGIYNVASYLDERDLALQVWGAHVAKVVR